MAFIPQQNLAQSKGRGGKSQAYSASSGMQVGKVISINRKLHKVDVVLQSGETLREVPVSSSALSTRTGYSYLAKVSNPVKSAVPMKAQGNFGDDRLRSVYCLIDYGRDDLLSPYVVAFLMPEVNQMTFDREGFAINRHETDQYSMTETDQDSNYDAATDTKLSNFEWVHPSGFWVRVGRGTVHEDLTTKDVQRLARFRGTPNANTAAGSLGPNPEDYSPVTLHHPSGTQIVIDTSGNIAIITGPGGNVTINGCAVITECNILEALDNIIVNHDDPTISLVDHEGCHIIVRLVPCGASEDEDGIIDTDLIFLSNKFGSNVVTHE